MDESSLDQPGPDRVTSLDVAAACGVSQSTVSRALSDDPRVSARTKVKVRAAARRLGYRPNIAARSLITSRTRTIGIAVSDINNPFYPAVIEALYTTLRELGYGTLLFNSELEYEDDPLAPFLGQAIDGILFCSARLGSTINSVAADLNLPAVFLVRHTGEDSSYVVSDNRGGAASVANLLADMGHKRIGLISGPEDTSTAIERDAGFTEALVSRGIGIPDELRRRGPYTYDVGFEEVIALMKADSPPTAIFCGNDVIAFGALNGIEKLGLKAPGDVSIVGFGDIPISGWPRINLTTVRQNLPEMAGAAARMLVDRIENGHGQPQKVVFDADLVYRGSAGPPGQSA